MVVGSLYARIVPRHAKVGSRVVSDFTAIVCVDIVAINCDGTVLAGAQFQSPRTGRDGKGNP